MKDSEPVADAFEKSEFDEVSSGVLGFLSQLSLFFSILGGKRQQA